MSTATWIAAVQTGGPDTKPASHPIGDEYFVLGLVAVLLGLIVLIFIRTSFRRSSKRQR